MLDLDLINNKTIGIKINGEIVKVKPPSYSLVLRTKHFFNNIEEIENKEDEQNIILLEFLNNNLNNKEFVKDDLMQMCEKALGALSNLLLELIMGIESDPN